MRIETLRRVRWVWCIVSLIGAGAYCALSFATGKVEVGCACVALIVWIANAMFAIAEGDLHRQRWEIANGSILLAMTKENE